MQNTIQVIAFILLNMCCLIYSGFQFQQLQEAMDQDTENSEKDVEHLKYLITRLLIVNVVIIGVCELIYLYLGARLYQEFG